MTVTLTRKVVTRLISYFLSGKYAIVAEEVHLGDKVEETRRYIIDASQIEFENESLDS